MEPRVEIYEALLVVAAFATGSVAIYAWHRRDELGATFLTAVLGSTAGWALASLLGSLVPGSRLALFAAKSIYLFVPVVVTGVFLFAIVYTGRQRWLDRRLYAVLAIEPVLLNVVVWTNGMHRQFWSTVTADPTVRIGWHLVSGPLFWGHVAYSYVLMFVATVWLVRFAFRAEHLYQRQVFGILFSLLAPWLGNVLFLSELIAFDPTPIAFAITGTGLLWAIVQTRFLDLAPIARDTVVDTISDGVIVVDENDVVVDSNPAAREMFDRSTSIVGESIDELLPDSPDIENEYRALRAVESEVSTDVEVEGRHYAVDASPLSDGSGENLGHLFMIRDVTEQKERQYTLEQRNRQLDHFAGVISHDLRNPLHVASGALELARETGDDEHFARAERAHERMERLIEDLLTLAREGQQIDDQQSVSIAEIARIAWDTVATGDATLDVEGDTTIQADPNRLQQLLENLYRNSVEHAGPEVHVRVAPTTDGFLVEDDGPGIPPAIRDSVVQEGYSTEESGAGIGLMIVRHVTEAHGWDLSIGESETGGARFVFDTTGDTQPAKKSSGG
jgi:PAS domain S-box-containing protein